ncbi:GNAT family N-acetyltransferase [Lysobacter sp. A6]|uniref:GNAT family N-acetyltransferase n=1 Tax=Noviluteimonas lactosilytica TaxID=2888523 RepID=A0ABS8JJ42_9GAMM|nr:GNAT family N-acetyltransferase [Lysobacter lactosilyticus]MCC8363621.1 GNAT family N-acetyltransferase [Lysobacter lactosilyticus]
MAVIRPIAAQDYEVWAVLFGGYAAFYQVQQSAQMRETVWSWLHDPAHELSGLIAFDAGGTAVGLAHYRPFARPLSATIGGWLDDLFVDPGARGEAIGKQLIAAVAAIGRERGWSVIRWLTAEDNYRARSSYDKIASKTKFLTYDLAL